MGTIPSIMGRSALMEAGTSRKGEAPAAAPLPVPPPLFAHPFGWDEIHTIAVPIVLSVLGLRYAASRSA